MPLAIRDMKIRFAILLTILIASCLAVNTATADEKKYKTVLLKRFTLAGASIQKNQDTEAFTATLPDEFSTLLSGNLYDMGIKAVLYKDGDAIPEDAVIVDGKFTKVTAGSASARLVVGQGSSGSTIGAVWSVKDATTGKEIEGFEKLQHTPSGHTGRASLDSDEKALAKHVAMTVKKLLK